MIKKFNEMNKINESNDTGVYHIFTSQDGVIYFDISKDLNSLRDNKYMFSFNFMQQYQSLQNHLEVIVDLNKMFVFIETSNGDSAEYKIFD